MKEYFVSIMAVSLIGGVIISMASNDGGGKHLRLLCSLCTVACVAFPLMSLGGVYDSKEDVIEFFRTEENDSEYYEVIYNNVLSDSQILNAENSLKSDMIQEFDVPSDAFDVKIVFENKDKESDKKYIRKIRMIIRSSGIMADPRSIEKYVYEKFGCECEFVYELQLR